MLILIWYYKLYASEKSKKENKFLDYINIVFEDESSVINGTYVEIIGNLDIDTFGTSMIAGSITDTGDKIKKKCNK